MIHASGVAHVNRTASAPNTQCPYVTVSKDLIRSWIMDGPDVREQLILVALEIGLLH